MGSMLNKTIEINNSCCSDGTYVTRIGLSIKSKFYLFAGYTGNLSMLTYCRNIGIVKKIDKI